MNAFVRACDLERSFVSSEYHMPERHCFRTSRQRGECCKSSLEQRAVCFDYSVNNRDMSTPDKGKRQHKADERGRPSPQVSEKPVHPSIISRATELTGSARREVLVPVR